MAIKKILIIDDEEHFCRALKKSLEMKSRWRVLTATRGDDGIRLATTQKPDLILLDVIMPDMAGTNVAEALSENPQTASIPIMYVTALITNKEIHRTGSVVGGRDFVAKPVIIDELIKKINAM